MNDAPPKKRLPLRWLSLAELVGLLALGIAAAGYWDAHRERTLQEAERLQSDRERAAESAAAARQQQAEARAAALKFAFLLTGTPDDAGDRVRLTSVHAEQVIQTQTLWFPADVRKDSVETTGNPRIEAGWLEGGLRRAAGKTRHGRVPVAIQTAFIEDGQTKTDASLYLLGYTLHPRLIGGDRLELEGLSLQRRGLAGDPQAAADDLWPGRGAGG
jgi:hypothetical protein